MARRLYQQGLRRTLLDMHIPDWDEAFLAHYDPANLVELYRRARITSAMLYCKSHVGLCYWPTKAGQMHRGLAGRDVVGELVERLRAAEIGVCAYYSIVFDNWAVETHPDWRQLTVAGNDYQGLIRYGVCCQNHPDYRAYEHAQVRDLLSRYGFDALFLDMIFWPLICACEHCRTRYREEAGRDIPTTVDWTNGDWCRFQTARERWSGELSAELAATARALSPGLLVTHNLAPALSNWTWGQPLGASLHDDFVAGDLYGDRIEQLVVGKLVLHLSRSRPAELMTSRCVNLADHSRLKSRSEMELQALAATALSSAFLFIDAVDPAGTLNADVYDRIGQVFERTAPYEPHLGGEPIEDVAVYLSVDSQMDFAETGTAVAAVGPPSNRYPHLESVRGACRALQRAHIPFGVITRGQLDELHRHRVVVLPDVARMDADEADAFRRYVSAGGRLYASRYTSLVSTAGERGIDFSLADVFGASYAGEETGAWVYVRPADDEVAAWIAPQTHLSHQTTSQPFGPPTDLCGTPRLQSEATGRVLGRVTLPYGYPSRGTVLDKRWASIHSSPPWDDLDLPSIVEHRLGEGMAIYSTIDVETADAETDAAMFLGIVRRLMGSAPTLEVDTHPAVWATAFDQPDRGRLMVSLLNYQGDLPPVAVPARITLRAPAGRTFTGLQLVPDETDLAFALDRHGRLRADLPPVELLTMVVASYRAS